MYRCQICNAVAQPGVPAHRIVIQTRPTEYPSRPKAQSQRVGRKARTSDDPGGAGYEIAKEAIACKSCAERHEATASDSESAFD